MNQTMFPQLFAQSFASGSPFWTASTDFTNSESLEECLYWVETEFVAAKDNADLVIQRAGCFINDLSALKQSDPQHSEIVDFLQFYIATGVLQYLSIRKIFPYCFDWIANALDGQVSTDKIRTINFDRLHQFGESENPFIIQYFSLLFCDWVHDLFYYSRSTGGHKEAAQTFVERYLYLFLPIAERIQSEKSVTALAQIATWCNQMGDTDSEKVVSKRMDNIYHSTTDSHLKKIVAFHFCVAAVNHTNTTRREWCEIVLKEHSGKLQQHEPVQLLVNLYHHDAFALVQHFDDILTAIKKYRSANPIHESQPLLSNYNSVRLFSILERTIITLLLAGEVQRVNQLIGVYFDIPEEELIGTTNCFIIPNHPEGVFYCFQGRVILSPSDSRTNIPAITKLTNAFLGVTHTFNNFLEFQLEAAEREGVPDYDYSEDVVNAIRAHFSFHKMLENPRILYCTGYYLQYGTQIPIQNIMAMDLGFTLPLIHSFRKPFRAKKINRVYIWEGETLLAEYERMGLQEIFAGFGVQVVYHAHHVSSKEQFLEEYANTAYDLVWVICHGQYFHHESHKSHLVLGPEINLYIHEIPPVPRDAIERRLLFIDACDGATTSLSNSPQSIGIGPAMIGPRQSLLSHGWPVDNHSSMVTGLLVAIFLCRGHSYAAAHYNAISNFKKGKEVVIAIVSEYVKNEEILERIRNKEMVYDNFMFWGSLLYME